MINKIVAGYIAPKGGASDTLFIKHSSFKPQIEFHVKHDIPIESVREAEVHYHLIERSEITFCAIPEECIEFLTKS